MGQSQAAGFGLVVAEGAVHLIAGEIGSFYGLLNRHAELHDIKKELKQVLLLGVPP